MLSEEALIHAVHYSNTQLLIVQCLANSFYSNTLLQI